MQRHQQLRIAKLAVGGRSSEENFLAQVRLEHLLKSWEGTPYREGWQYMKKGVDCVRFVSYILDTLQGTVTDIKTLPQDAGLHDREGAIKGLKRLLRHFPSYTIPGPLVQPGDVAIAGPCNGGPSHGMIVGKDNVWHCVNFGVCKAGLSFNVVGNLLIKEIRRLKNRESWTLFS